MVPSKITTNFFLFVKNAKIILKNYKKIKIKKERFDKNVG